MFQGKFSSMYGFLSGCVSFLLSKKAQNALNTELCEVLWDILLIRDFLQTMLQYASFFPKIHNISNCSQHIGDISNNAPNYFTFTSNSSCEFTQLWFVLFK